MSREDVRLSLVTRDGRAITLCRGRRVSKRRCSYMGGGMFQGVSLVCVMALKGCVLER